MSPQALKLCDVTFMNNIIEHVKLYVLPADRHHQITVRGTGINLTF
jgi:hypothetical protein